MSSPLWREIRGFTGNLFELLSVMNMLIVCDYLFLYEEQVNEYRSVELAQNPLNDLFSRPLLEFFGTQSCDSEGLFWF